MRREREGVPPPDVRNPRHRGAEADRHRAVYLLTVPVLCAASASARRRFSSSMNFMSISLSHSGKRLRWIVCQWRPSLYLPPFSLFSSMISPRHAASCANWNISVSKSTRSTRSTRSSKKVLQLPQASRPSSTWRMQKCCLSWYKPHKIHVRRRRTARAMSPARSLPASRSTAP